MNQAKKYLAILIALLVPLGVADSARADGETVTAKSTVVPFGGKFFKEVRVSSKLAVEAVVTPNPASATVLPSKNIKLVFPAGLAFNPNRNVCPDSKLNSQSSLGSPSAIVNACRNAVIGTGTAVIYLAKVSASPLNDPILIAFNAGKTRLGEPRLKIYGYSKSTGVGILMTAVLKGRNLNIAIPVLSFDSAVGEFKLQIPGPVLERPALGLKVKGLDRNYVKASCPRSPLATSATFSMGERDASTGAPIGPTTTFNSPLTSQNCSGLAGRPRLQLRVTRGPRAVKRGRLAAFRVYIRNSGTATARNVVVTATGGGKCRAGKIAPGRGKTVTVKTRVRGRKYQRVKIRFVARSGNVRAFGARFVRVR